MGTSPIILGLPLSGENLWRAIRAEAGLKEIESTLQISASQIIEELDELG
jgi:hypothetical protein